MAFVSHSDEFAAVIAQIVPVLLLAGVAIPLRLTGTPLSRPRALLDLALTGVLVGTSALTEFAALFGVWQGGLSARDRHLLAVLLAWTGLIAMTRVLTPVTREYAIATRIPERRVWIGLGVLISGAFIVLLFGLS